MPKQDLREDIKGKRESHLSSPVGNDTEFHIRDSELSMKPEIGTKYYMCFPVLCTSDGNDSGVPMHRFVQQGKPDVSKETEHPGDKNSKLKKAAGRMFGAKEGK